MRYAPDRDRRASHLLGGLMLARAVKDRTISDHILEACHAEVLRELDGARR